VRFRSLEVEFSAQILSGCQELKEHKCFVVLELKCYGHICFPPNDV